MNALCPSDLLVQRMSDVSVTEVSVGFENLLGDNFAPTSVCAVIKALALWPCNKTQLSLRSVWTAREIPPESVGEEQELLN